MKNKNMSVPISEKYTITIKEAIEYYSIGRDKLYQLVKMDGNKFVLRNGKNILIKRKLFEKYLEQNTYI